MSAPLPISINDALAQLTFLPDRTPMGSEDSSSAFARLSTYRDGGIFVGHWAGESEWERHAVADEIVMILDGETTITFRKDGGDASVGMTAGQLVVVPQGTWHRFHTPEAVKVLSVTPQPTEHTAELPD